MTTLQRRLLQCALFLCLGTSCCIGEVFLILMFLPPFALLGWMFLPIVLVSFCVTAYSIAWLIYLSLARVDGLADLPYNPKRVFKIVYLLFHMILGSLRYLPLVAEYGYYRAFVLGKRYGQVVIEDIYYGSEHESNRLDVYKPDEFIRRGSLADGKDCPVVVFVHGGAWSSGNKLLYSLLALRLRSMGYVVVVPNFTLYPQGDVGDMVSDLKRVLVWTNEYIRNHQGDPKNIYMMGHSSGAHLIALLFVLDALRQVLGHKEKRNLKLKDIDSALAMPKIAGLILMAGVFDITQHYYWESKRCVEEISAMARAMGNTTENFDMNSPTILLKRALSENSANLNKVLPKMLLIHGDKDDVVPVTSTLRFYHVLCEHKVRDVRLHLYPGMNHEDPVTGLMISPITNKHTAQLTQDIASFISV